MNLLDNLWLGLGTALQWQQLLPLLAGCVLGSLASATRRLGLLAVLAMLLPVFQHLDILPALMAIVGVYCGANGGVIGGWIGSPEQSNGAVAAFPCGPATPHGACAMLAAATPLVPLVAGLLGAGSIVAFAPLLIEQAFRFGPAEYFSLMAVGLTTSVVFGPGSLVKAMATLVLGVMLSQLSVDPATGHALFNFQLGELEPGFGLIPAAMGLAVIARVTLTTAAGRSPPGAPMATSAAAQRPRFHLLRQWPQLLRGAVIGSLIGTVPGGGARLASHVALAAEDKILRQQGAVGVDPIADPAPAAALVTAVRSSLVPLLAFGFPVNASLALTVGVMVGKQVAVGPQLMTSRPDLFWGSIAAVGLASVLLFLVSGVLGRLTLKARQLALDWLPAVMVIYCCVGAYAMRNSAFDIFVLGAFALLGHWLFKFGCRIGPLIMGFVLGPMLESNLRHALELSGGNWSVLITRPISAGLLLVAAGVVCAVMLPSLRQRRARIFDHED